MRHMTLCLVILLVLLPAASFGKQVPSLNEKATATYFDAIRTSPPMLRGFLAQMPKGADLHTHLSGAVYAEDFLQWAMEDGRCINTTTFAVSPAPQGAGKKAQPCPGGTVAAGTLADNTALYSAAVNAFSTRDRSTNGWMWGHDQFFSTFGKFGVATVGRTPDMLASVVRRAAAQHILYLEVMSSIYPGDLKAIAKAAGWNGKADKTLAALRAKGLFDSIPQSIKQRTDELAIMRAQLGNEGKDIAVAFIQQINRTAAPEQVFAQLAYSFELVRQSAETVSLNLVAPEDNPVALRDYALHMAMIDALYSRPEYTGTNITLHAGELTLGLVPPRHLRSHIRDAITAGHARRIGHGVDALYEDAPMSLLRQMHREHIAVEVCLTSNDVILNVTGAEHPFDVYRQQGVPVVLNTDDEGVSRIDLTNEYVRAARDYNLSYDNMKTLSRNSLEYSFLPGESLWANPETFTMHDACKDSLIGHETATCNRLLEKSPRAKMQWRLEKALTAFERTIATRYAQ